MNSLIFWLGFLGLTTCTELCGESCEDLDQQFKDINEIIAQLKSENEAIEAENAAIEREINRLYIKIFPTEVHSASCQEILEKSLDLKSETGFVYSNGEPEYKVGIEDINQKGFKYFKIDASDFDNFAQIGLTPYPSGESVTWEITLVDEQDFIGISHVPSQNPEWPDYLVSTNTTASNWTWEDVRGSLMLTFGNGFIRIQHESLEGDIIIELKDHRVNGADINHIMTTTTNGVTGYWSIVATNKVIGLPDEDQLPPNGMYRIHPSIALDPFWVECQFSGANGATYLYPNMTHDDGFTSTPGQEDGCLEPGCFVDEVSYNSTSKDQIEALLAVSFECAQEIVHKCSVNSLTNKAWWLDRNGDRREYWHGDKGNDKGQGCFCSLGPSYECINFHNPSKDNICNCDDMNSADVDSGLLTNKNQLPVSQLNYGDSAGRYSWIEYELGPLICQGQGGLYPSESFEHDFKFKVAANTQESGFLTAGYNIAFDDVIYDGSKGSLRFGLNGTAGLYFIAPLDGYWKFDLFLGMYGQTYYIFTINVVVNGEVVDYFQMNHDDVVAEGPEGYAFTVANDYSENVMLKLKIGDRVNFYVADLPYPPTENYADGCQTGEITHSCSSITGEYLYL